MQLAKTSADGEVRPIEDIRSAARYRAAVAGNLVVEFLEHWGARGGRTEHRKKVLARWNKLPPEEAAQSILSCCGSKAWARGMADRRPILDDRSLLAVADEVSKGLRESDWMEAFSSHPRIGESASQAETPTQSAAWSGEEQQSVAASSEAVDVKVALAEGNRAYERRFSRLFIVCATGKSAPEILEILQRRLQNDETTELCEAAEQQRQIAHLRLKK